MFRGDKDHLDYWIEHSLPVLIILHDTESYQSYWQAIKIENVISTGKGWKIIVPQKQRINPGMDVDLKILIAKIPMFKKYTIASMDDVTNSVAKRYSLRVILNKEHTQSELVDLIKSLTIEASNSDYHRNDITRKQWQNKAAQIVWLFIYPSAEDEKNNNFICQTEWFSESLDPEAFPLSNGGDEISKNLRVRWNDAYLTWSKFNFENTISKEEFFRSVTDISKNINVWAR